MSNGVRVWWLRQDGEVCVFCAQCVAHGAEVRCVACDRAVCGHCVAYAPAPAREPFCPECVGGEEGD